MTTATLSDRLALPTRLRLSASPTPLQPLRRLSKVLNKTVLIKRDDLTGSVLSGNKIRKLEFLAAEAQELGATTLITCGGEQSNHCRATAVVASKLGLGCTLLLRTEDPNKPPATTGNILLDRLVGANIRWISFEEYGRRNELLAETSTTIEQQGGTPYVIPEGGSNALGSWGYVLAAWELSLQLDKDVPTSIVYACGSGGTGAGLILGGKFFDYNSRSIAIHGINVCDDREYFVRTIGAIYDDFAQKYPDDVLAPMTPQDIDIIDGYVGRGYSKSSPEELKALRDLARLEGIVLDPTYSGKAYFGLLKELSKDPDRFGQRIVFLHTGGIFSLFADTCDFAQMLG